MGGVKSTLFRELRVAVQVAEIDGREVKLDNIKCSYSVSIDASSKLAVVSFGDLFEDEQRDLLITVSVSRTAMTDGNDTAIPAVIHLAGANCKYTNVLQNVEVAGLPDGPARLFIKTSPNAPPISARNARVTGQQLRLLALDAMQVSMQLADSGNYSIAVARLNNAIKSAIDLVAQAYGLPEVSVRALLDGTESTQRGPIPADDIKMYSAVISDLKNSIKRCESSTAHNSFGGKLGQNNITKTYQSQRATYTAFGAVQENVFAQTSAMQTSFGYHNKKSAIAQRAASSAFGNFSVSASPVSGNNAILGNKVKPKTSWSFFGKGSGSRNPPPPPPPPAGI
ncbi:hypothetical protein BC830DRAFT_1109133 [Chytriomyces sp. MP71]|nr:hypothetical protein BC830DRAFT_1109133 [Chytriomyces sp. MP71]